MDNRYYFEHIEGGKVYIEKQEMAHLIRVRRAHIGDEITAFNGDGYDYHLKICAINKNDVRCEIISKKKNKADDSSKVTVFLAMLKNDAMNLAIDYLTELNVTKCCIFPSNRSVAQLDEKKLDKLKQISIQAAKQCERARIMDIEIISKNRLIEMCKDLKNVFFAYEDATDAPSSFNGDLAVIIGPEGGFSPDEVELFSMFSKQFSLGKTILRAEVACVAAVTALKAVQNG